MLEPIRYNTTQKVMAKLLLRRVKDAGLLLAVLTGLIVLASQESTEQARLLDPAAHRRSLNAANTSAAAPASEMVFDIITSGDHAWVLARTFAIITMQGGFALLEAGSVRKVNRANIMMKNIADISIGLAGYLLLGYSLSFDNGDWFSGGTRLACLRGIKDSDYSFVILQFAFAATTGTIISGAVAERIKFVSYIFLSVGTIALIYPPVAHWAWHPNGWLYQRGFIDFAGSGVVHLLGGAAALMSTAAIGPRKGRFSGDSPARRLYKWFIQRQSGGDAPEPSGSSAPPTRLNAHDFREAHDPVNIIYGTFILSVGWLSFNCGSALGLSNGRPGQASLCVTPPCLHPTPLIRLPGAPIHP